MRRFALIAIAVGLLAGGGTSSTPAAGRGELVAFASNRSPWLERDHVYTVSAHGGRARPLLLGTAPTVSPDGRRLAYFEGSRGRVDLALYVRARSGGKPRRVARSSPVHQLATWGLGWSPDGKKLTYGVLGPALEIADLSRGTLIDVPNTTSVTWSPDSRRIAYLDTSRNPALLTVARADGSDSRVIAHAGASYAFSSVAWSPDGRWIVYSSGEPLRLVRIRPDGTGRVALGSFQAQGLVPAWSRDGRRLAYVAASLDAKRIDLRILRTDDWRPIESLRLPFVPAATPLWSQDEREIALVGSGRMLVADLGQRRVRRVSVGRAHLEAAFAQWWRGRSTLLFSGRVLENDFELYTVRPNGTHARALTNDDVDERDPAWSPDGTRLAYVRGKKRLEVCVVGSTTGRRRCLGTRGRDTYSPAWSPDGARIAYVRGGGIRIVRASGGEERRVSPAVPVYTGAISWSPDGTRIVFSSESLYIVDVTTGALRRLTTEYDTQPAWSPDGSRILFRSYRDERFFRDPNAWGLFTVDPAVGEPSVQRVTTGFYLHPAWSRDGTRIAFEYGHAIHTISANGTNERRLTGRTGSVAVAEHPVWRP